MKNKKLFGLFLAVGLLGTAALPAGQVFASEGAGIDSADSKFIEYVKEDTDYNGEIDYTYSPLYDEELSINGRHYDFSFENVEGYALLVQIQSANNTFYEVEEVFYNSASPFENCTGLPVYITRGLYLEYRNEAFYNLESGQLIEDSEVSNAAIEGFGYRGTWEFEPRYQYITYATRSKTSYSIQYDLPNYYGSPGTVCASIAGGVVIGYYDRFKENLIPDYQVYTLFGSRIIYKAATQTILDLIDDLYVLMGGEVEHLGVTFSEYQYGMNTYIAGRGHTYSTNSVFSYGNFDFNKYKAAVESNKPVALFLDNFAIRDYIDTNGDTDTIKSDFSSTPHVVVGCGYEQYKYYNAAGVEIDNRIYLKVATSLPTYQISYININGLSTINEAISSEII